MASTPSTIVDPEAAAIDSLSKGLDRMDSLSKRLDRMMRRMEETLARMDSAPASVASATSSSASSSLTPARVSTTTASTPSPTAAAAATAGVVITNAPSPATSPTSSTGAPDAPMTAAPALSSIPSMAAPTSPVALDVPAAAPATSPVVQTPSTTSTTPPAPTSTTIFPGVQKVFAEMATSSYVVVSIEDDYMRSSLGVRDRRICKASTKRLRYLNNLKRCVSLISRDAPPARCSMAGRSHGERALAPLTVVSASPSTLGTASDASVARPATSPTRCSPTCLSHENNMLKSYSVECSKPPPTSTHAEVVFDEMHQRYIITPTSAYSVGSVLLCLVTQVQDAQKVWEPMVVLSPVFLEPWPAIVVDMRHGQSSLNSEQHCIPPKPPWSLLCLEDDSSKSNISAQFAWILCSYHFKNSTNLLTDDTQLRPIPWPSFTSDTVWAITWSGHVLIYVQAIMAKITMDHLSGKWTCDGVLLSETIGLCFSFWTPFSCGCSAAAKATRISPVQLGKILSMVCSCSDTMDVQWFQLFSLQQPKHRGGFLVCNVELLNFQRSGICITCVTASNGEILSRMHTFAMAIQHSGVAQESSGDEHPYKQSVLGKNLIEQELLLEFPVHDLALSSLEFTQCPAISFKHADLDFTSIILMKHLVPKLEGMGNGKNMFLVIFCQHTKWSVPNGLRGWQVFDRGKFKKGCNTILFQMAGIHEAKEIVSLIAVKISVTSHSDSLELFNVDETKITPETSLTHCQARKQQLDHKTLRIMILKWSSTSRIKKPSSAAICSQQQTCWLELKFSHVGLTTRLQELSSVQMTSRAA